MASEPKKMPPTAEATSNLTTAEITTNFLPENRGDNVVLCNYEFYEFTEKWLLGMCHSIANTVSTKMNYF